MQCSVHQLRELISEAIRKAYEILGVDQSASPEQIKKAYLKKAVLLHPDRNKGQDTAAEMVKVNVAYGLLSDPDKKRKYDMSGDKTLGDTGSTGGFGGSSDWWANQAADWADWKKQNVRQPGAASGANYAESDAEWVAAQAKKWKEQQNQAKERAKQWQESEPTRQRQYDAQDNKQYFQYSDAKSNKFWWIMRNANYVTTGYGRIGTFPKTMEKKFNSVMSAQRYVENKILQKKQKGYVSRSTAQGPEWEYQKQKSATPKKSASSSQQKAAAPKGSSKSTYKIYGKRGQAPAHTRFKGKVYAAGSGTKFRNGDQAAVSVGPDGKLNVKDPKTGHTQNWDTSESVFQDLVDDMMFLNESLLTNTDL